MGITFLSFSKREIAFEGNIDMGLFGSSSGDTSSGGGLNFGSGGDYGSKLRTPSYSSGEFDLDSAGGGATSSLDLAGGDFQKGLQLEQQKANLMTQIHNVNE